MTSVGGADVAGWSPASAAQAVDRLWGRLVEAVHAIGPGEWHRPTPCARWDVADLVAHVAGVGGLFAGVDQPAVPEGWAAPPGLGALDAMMEAGVVARRGSSPDALRAELAAVRSAHVGAVAALPDLDGPADGPTGPTTQLGLLQVRAFDMWVHLWDLRAALDVRWDPTADTSGGAAACHGYVVGLVPYLLGKRAGAPEGTRVALRLEDPMAGERVVAVVDGRGRWLDAGADADQAVTGPPAALTLLLVGRIDRGAATAMGLTAEGPQASALLDTRVFG